jgi:hypothetical protein
MTRITCVILLTLLSAASAARPHRGNVLALGPMNDQPQKIIMGVAEQQQQQDVPATVTTTPAAQQQTALVVVPRGLTTLTPLCSAAYDLLNNDEGYVAAINAVFDDARAVGKAAGEKCYAALKPSYTPLGGYCTADAQPFWTPERRADLVTLAKASDAVVVGLHKLNPVDR